MGATPVRTLPEAQGSQGQGEAVSLGHVLSRPTLPSVSQLPFRDEATGHEHHNLPENMRHQYASKNRGQGRGLPSHFYRAVASTGRFQKIQNHIDSGVSSN